MERLDVLTAMFYELKRRGVISSQKELASFINGNESSMSCAFKGDSSYLTLKLLQRINAASGNIFNAAWIRTGEGEMLASKTAEVQNFIGGNAQVGDGNIYNDGADAQEVESLRRENENLREQNADLRKQVAEKEKAIARLEGKIEIYKEMLGK